MIISIGSMSSRSSISEDKWVLVQQQPVLLQGCIFLPLLLFLLSQPAAWLQPGSARPGSVCLGLVRLGPQTQWPTFSCSSSSSCSSCRLAAASPQPRSAPTPITSGSIRNKYRSGGFSYLSVKSAPFYCPDFFSLLSPVLSTSSSSSPPLLGLSFSSADLPLLSCSFSSSSRTDQSADVWSVFHGKLWGAAQLVVPWLSTTVETEQAVDAARRSAQPQWSRANEGDFR